MGWGSTWGGASPCQAATPRAPPLPAVVYMGGVFWSPTPWSLAGCCKAARIMIEEVALERVQLTKIFKEWVGGMQRSVTRRGHKEEAPLTPSAGPPEERKRRQTPSWWLQLLRSFVKRVWASYLTSLCLSFPKWRMEKVTVPPSRGHSEDLMR